MPRIRYVQDPLTLELVPADEYHRRPDPHAPYVMPDIDPYQSMATGEMITSRSHHREHLKKHRLVEIGNEVDYHMKHAQPKPKDDREGRKRAIADALNRLGY